MPQDIALALLKNDKLNIILSILNAYPKKIMIMQFIFFNKKNPKILENIMIFLPNVLYNSPFFKPIIQHVGLKKCQKQTKSDANEM